MKIERIRKDETVEKVRGGNLSWIQYIQRTTTL